MAFSRCLGHLMVELERELDHWTEETVRTDSSVAAAVLRRAWWDSAAFRA